MKQSSSAANDQAQGSNQRPHRSSTVNPNGVGQNEVKQNEVKRTVGKQASGKITGARTTSGKRSAASVSYRLTREGWQICFMIGFVILGAILRDVNLLVLIAGTLIALLLIQWRVALKTIYRLTVQRQFPRSMQAKKPFEVELSVTNPKRWLGSWWVNAEEKIWFERPGPRSQTTSPSRAYSSGGASPVLHSSQIYQTIQLLFPSVPPESTRSLKYLCCVENRGRYHFNGTVLSSRFPLGLLRSILKSNNVDAVLVHPANGILQPGWKELFRGRRTGTHESSSRSLSDQGEFFGLRSYHPGDSPRWIHWRSTARRNELMVKQYQQSSSQELILLLDIASPQLEHSTSENETKLQQSKSRDGDSYGSLSLQRKSQNESTVSAETTFDPAAEFQDEESTKGAADTKLEEVSPTAKTAGTWLRRIGKRKNPNVASNSDSNETTEICIEFAATVATYVANSSSTILTLAIADSEPTVASKLQTRGQAMAVLDRLSVAHPEPNPLVDSLANTLELLEREFRRVDNLVVVSTRSKNSAMGNDLLTDSGKRILPFWNQITWVDVRQGELTPYFKPAQLPQTLLESADKPDKSA